MSRDPIAALDEAIAGLEMELAANPRFVLLQNLKAARCAFPGGTPVQIQPVRKTASDEKPTGRQMSPARKRALDLSEAFLREEGGIIKSRDIYSYVELNGITLTGGANNLASLLGRYGDIFVSHGREGWSLKAEGSGALNGHAASAPSTEGVAALSIDNSADELL